MWKWLSILDYAILKIENTLFLIFVPHNANNENHQGREVSFLGGWKDQILYKLDMLAEVAGDKCWKEVYFLQITVTTDGNA